MYSIKTVCAETGLLPVTLRAWEARYHVVAPSRSKSNYRLYTDREVALLRLVKQQVDSGTPIRLVAAEVRRLRRAGKIPDAPVAPALSVRTLKGGDPAPAADCLFRALIGHGERSADRCLAAALARFDRTRVCLEVIIPCLWRIGDAWERGKIRIATEHFASTLLRGRLLAWFQSTPGPRSGPLVLAGCAPHEFHDIGALMLSLLLRQSGRRVEFLGQDLNLDDLRAYAREIRPAFICLSANAAPTAEGLIGFEQSLAALRPRPRFGFGGRAFDRNPPLRTGVGGVFLGETLPDAMIKIQRLLAS